MIFCRKVFETDFIRMKRYIDKVMRYASNLEGKFYIDRNWESKVSIAYKIAIECSTYRKFLFQMQNLNILRNSEEET